MGYFATRLLGHLLTNPRKAAPQQGRLGSSFPSASAGARQAEPRLGPAYSLDLRGPVQVVAESEFALAFVAGGAFARRAKPTSWFSSHPDAGWLASHQTR